MRKVGIILTLCCLFQLVAVSAWAMAPEYKTAVLIGEHAAQEAAGMLGQNLKDNPVIVLTNAGYARPGDHSTMGCVDGLAEATSASVGSSTLLVLQSRPDASLWFAFFAVKTGECAYLEPEGDIFTLVKQSGKSVAWAVRQKARIDADYIFSHADAFKATAEKGLFGKNLFRVVTVANAAARNCPDRALQAMRVHDHFCPGITSGIILADYIQREVIKPGQKKIFILSLVPWCKEDALTTLLNATPGKRAYAVLYGDKKKAAAWPAPLNRTCTVAFTPNEEGIWTGRLLGFDFNAAKKQYQDRAFGQIVLDKLYADLWFLDHLEEPASFVEELGQVTLPEGTSPKDLVRPDSRLLKQLVPAGK